MPEISVVFATHNRPHRLHRQLAALREQTLSNERYEVVVVDDGSGSETERVIAEAAEAYRADDLTLTKVRTEGRGPAVARNRGWNAAAAPLIAFTDDDCEAPPQWLERGLRAARATPDQFVQGPVAPIPAEVSQFGPFSHTLIVDRLGPGFETANIFYPLTLLERLGGFDEQYFSMAGGEDSDLAWRAIEAGVVPAWAADVLTHHAVENIGPVRSIRRAWHWHETILAFKRHPGMRAQLHRGVFWSPGHVRFLRAAVAVGLPRRLWPLRLWLAAPYVNFLVNRRSGPLLAPYLIAYDLAEIAACIRGSLRYRVMVL